MQLVTVNGGGREISRAGQLPDLYNHPPPNLGVEGVW